MIVDFKSETSYANFCQQIHLMRQMVVSFFPISSPFACLHHLGVTLFVDTFFFLKNRWISFVFVSSVVSVRNDEVRFGSVNFHIYFIYFNSNGDKRWWRDGILTFTHRVDCYFNSTAVDIVPKTSVSFSRLKGKIAKLTQSYNVSSRRFVRNEEE